MIIRLVAILCSLSLGLAVFLPWDQPGEALDLAIIPGVVLLSTTIISLVFAIYGFIKKTNRFGWVFMISALIALTIVAYSFINYAEDSGPDSIVLDNFGAGLYLAIVSSFLLAITGFFMQRAWMAEGIHQGPVANFVAKRIAFNQQKSFSRFIIRLSIVATVISVAVMVITLAFANGFQETVSQKVFSFWGHIRIQEMQPDKSVIAEEIPIIANDTLVRAVKRDQRVQSIHPFATKYAILKTKDEIEGVLVKGLDATYDFGHFAPFLKEGRPIRFNDSSYSRDIMISAFTADQLQLKVNDRVLIYFVRPETGEDAGSVNIRPDKLTIAGIYKTGIEEYDKTFAIGDIKLIQRLNDWAANEIGGYEVFLKNYKQMDRAVQEFYELDEFPQGLDTRSVHSISPNIFDWLNMQDVTRNLLIGFMIAIAVINLITCLLILVLERVRMIGVLKSLGATNWTIQRIFLQHAIIITVTGIVIGITLALIFLYIQKETGFIKLKEEAYYISEAAVKIVWWQIAMIAAGTLLVCFLILMIPSILVRKVQPVKAIHFR
ncbi:MAG TPA: FtsX-like permease family protein [Chitinophagaceae bacterium]